MTPSPPSAELVELRNWVANNPTKALVVDDDDYDRLILIRALQRAGYEIPVVECGMSKDALAFLESGGTAHVAFLDIGMPDMNGWDLMHVIRQKFPGVRCVIYTGGQVDPGSCIAAGAVSILIKPPTPSAIRQLLRGELRL